jgi:hypothetical protein
VTARAPGLVPASLHGDDPFRGQTRDTRLDEARHDRRVRELLDFGVGDLERSEQRDARFLLALPWDPRSFLSEPARRTSSSGALDSNRYGVWTTFVAT